MVPVQFQLQCAGYRTKTVGTSLHVGLIPTCMESRQAVVFAEETQTHRDRHEKYRHTSEKSL